MRNTDITAKTRTAVYERDGHACVVCCRTNGLQVHHRRPRGMGGTRRPETNQPGNLLTLCADHHRYVEHHRQEAIRAGFLVPQHADPESIPVATWRGLALFKNDGTIQLTGANA